ncbi:hypothetical protein KPP23_049 [Pseudomonas phage KPP23]|nr:hypothetical protein KPP23_049 [Pseudomonas phage KPP23]
MYYKIAFTKTYSATLCVQLKAHILGVNVAAAKGALHRKLQDIAKFHNIDGTIAQVHPDPSPDNRGYFVQFVSTASRITPRRAARELAAWLDRAPEWTPCYEWDPGPDAAIV